MWMEIFLFSLYTLEKSEALTWHDNFHLFISHSCSVQCPKNVFIPFFRSNICHPFIHNHSRVFCSIPLLILLWKRILSSAIAVARVMFVGDADIGRKREIENDVKKGVLWQARLLGFFLWWKNVYSKRWEVIIQHKASWIDLHYRYHRSSLRRWTMLPAWRKIL